MTPRQEVFTDEYFSYIKTSKSLLKSFLVAKIISRHLAHCIYQIAIKFTTVTSNYIKSSNYNLLGIVEITFCNFAINESVIFAFKDSQVSTCFDLATFVNLVILCCTNVVDCHKLNLLIVIDCYFIVFQCLCDALLQTLSDDLQLGVIKILSTLCQSVVVSRLSPQLGTYFSLLTQLPSISWLFGNSASGGRQLYTCILCLFAFLLKNKFHLYSHHHMIVNVCNVCHMRVSQNNKSH